MKFFLFIAILLWTTPNLVAGSTPEPVCSKSELAWTANERFINLYIYSAITSAILLDTQTLKIDTKNKIIEAWIIDLRTIEGKVAAEKRGLKDLGYLKGLWIIDYVQMRHKLKASIVHSCRGDAIDSFNNGDNSHWETIFPGSVNEAITKNIMAQYKLK